MKKRHRSILEEDVVVVNDWNEDKNFVLGEWTMTRRRLFGIPIYYRSFRRDTTKAVATTRNKHIGFKNNKKNDS